MVLLQLSGSKLGGIQGYGKRPAAGLRAAPRPSLDHRLFSAAVYQNFQKSSRLSHHQHSNPIKRLSSCPSSSSHSTWVSADCTTVMDPFGDGQPTQDSMADKTKPSGHSKIHSVRDDYEFKDVIGRGTYGVVYSAVELATGQNVAIKKVPTDGKRINQVRREADAMQRLSDCPSAVQLRGFYDDEGDVDKSEEDGKFSYIAMEYCRGGDLEKVIKDHGPLTEVQGAKIAGEALSLVGRCHEAKLLHGDIKSANFALRSEADREMLLGHSEHLGSHWLKGIDFGTCIEVGMGAIKTQVGTPTHWAPEVFGCAYGLEADLWSLGVMLYRILSGRMPFCDKQEEAALKSTRELLHMICGREPDFGYGPWMTCSSEVIDFLQALLNKDAKKRMTAKEGLEHSWMIQQMKLKDS